MSAWLIAAAAASTFNLSCELETTTSAKGMKTRTGTTTRTFSVDLNARRYCAYSCRSTLPIQEISPTLITFTSGDSHVLTVDRETGGYIEVLEAEGITYELSGMCEPKPFTGLPTPKF